MLATGLTLQPPGAVAQRPPQQGMINGMMSAKPLSTLVAEETAAAVARAQQAAAEPVVSNLVSYVRTHWSQAKQAKQSIEQEMLIASAGGLGDLHDDLRHQSAPDESPAGRRAADLRQRPPLAAPAHTGAHTAAQRGEPDHAGCAGAG